MKPRYVVDTNVLIAASAADPQQLKDIDATPADPGLRLQVWAWLDRFRSSEARMVLDTDNKIFEEYTNKLGFNDFGIQVVMHKWSTAATDDVTVQYDADGHGVLPSSLVPVNFSVISDSTERAADTVNRPSEPFRAASSHATAKASACLREVCFVVRWMRSVLPLSPMKSKPAYQKREPGFLKT